MRRLGRMVGDLVWAAAGVVFLLIIAVFLLGFVRRHFAGTVFGRVAGSVENLAGLHD